MGGGDLATQGLLMGGALASMASRILPPSWLAFHSPAASYLANKHSHHAQHAHRATETRRASPQHRNASCHAAAAAEPGELSSIDSLLSSDVGDPVKNQEQLAAKVARVRSLFSDLCPLPELEVFASPASHFRMRAEFAVQRDGDDCHYVMFAKPPGAGAGRKEATAVRLEAFPIASQLINELMPLVQRCVREQLVLRDRLFQASAAWDATWACCARVPSRAGSPAPAAAPAAAASMPGPLILAPWSLTACLRRLTPLTPDAHDAPDACYAPGPVCFEQVNFHTTLSGQAMVSLLYHKRLEEEQWTAAAQAMRQQLAQAAPLLRGQLPTIIGRSRKQLLALDATHVTESLTVAGRTWVYRQNEGAFSQPNAHMCQHMLSWAMDVTSGAPGDLLELYCGNGNFTIPLASNFRSVVATEVSKSSVAAARWSIEANYGAGASSNIFLARMSSEEFTETWRAKGTRRRLAGLRPWEQLQLGTLLVDPPRSGLDPATAQLLKEFPRVLYISCSPETLRRDLEGVAGRSHAIQRFAVFDQVREVVCAPKHACALTSPVLPLRILTPHPLCTLLSSVQFPYTGHVECGVWLTAIDGASSSAAAV